MRSRSDLSITTLHSQNSALFKRLFGDKLDFKIIPIPPDDFTDPVFTDVKTILQFAGIFSAKDGFFVISSSDDRSNYLVNFIGILNVPSELGITMSRPTTDSIDIPNPIFTRRHKKLAP